MQCADAGILHPAAVLATPHEALCGAGLSRAKASYLHDLAAHFADGRLSNAAIAGMGAPALRTALTAVRGLGPWSVDMFTMFHLGLPDVLPVGDLGVRRGMQALYGLRDLPSPAQMEAVAERWRPWRSVGAYYMWRVEAPRGAKKAGGGAGSKKRA
jgi:DNA-3-methyladenine glycosylase II